MKKILLYALLSLIAYTGTAQKKPTIGRETNAITRISEAFTATGKDSIIDTKVSIIDPNVKIGNGKTWFNKITGTRYVYDSLTNTMYSDIVYGSTTPTPQYNNGAITIDNRKAVWKNPNISVNSGETIDHTYQNGVFRPVKAKLDFLDFGGKINPDSAFRKMLSFYKSNKLDAIRFPNGVYNFDSVFTYQTSGYARGIQIEGESLDSTILKFRNVSNKNFLSIDACSIVPYEFQRGGYIKNLTISSTAVTDNTQGAGVSIVGWWNFHIESIRIENVKSLKGAIDIPLRTDINVNPDAYATIGEISKCYIIRNQGIGINVASGIGADMTIFDNKIYENRQGGILVGGSFENIYKNVIATNGWDNAAGYGLKVAYIQGSTNIINVNHNEFDSNRNAHIFLEGCTSSTIWANRFISWEHFGQLYAYSDIHFKTVAGSTVRNMKIYNNTHRSEATNNYNHVMYLFDGSYNFVNNVITDYSIIDNTSQLKVDSANVYYENTVLKSSVQKMHYNMLSNGDITLSDLYNSLNISNSVTSAVIRLDMFKRDLGAGVFTNTHQFVVNNISNNSATMSFPIGSSLYYQNTASNVTSSTAQIPPRATAFFYWNRGYWSYNIIVAAMQSSASVSITSLASGTPQTQNFTVTGAITGQKVDVYDTGGTVLSSTVTVSKAYVSASNTVTLEFSRSSGTTANVTGNLQLEVK